MDSIKIIIQKDCDENGDGKIVENVLTLLSPLPDGPSAVDVLVAAFADAYPHEMYDNPDFDADKPEDENNVRQLKHTPYRNYTIKLRKYSEVIVKPFLKKAMQAQLDTQVEALTEQVFGGIQVLDKLSE